MTAEQQRIAIAVTCGWRPGCFKTVWGDGQTFGIPPNGEDWHWQETPDYLNDLNAMHEAEKILDWSQKENFRHILACKYHTLDDEGWGLAYAKAIHADATQRAEAFLRAIGKWEETPQ